MLQPGVKHFLDAVKLGPPEFLHFLKSAVHSIKAAIDFIKAAINLFKALLDLIKTLVNLFKTLVDLIEALVDLVETSLHVVPQIAQTGVVDQDPDQDRDHSRHGCQRDRQELRVGHASLVVG